MPRTTEIFLLATIGGLCGALIGCVFLTDPDSLSEGCPEREKLCGGECVSTTDDDFGCSRPGCSPCDLYKATSKCGPEGACVVSSCVGSWSDCDRESENGCEVDLDTDVNNCGVCDQKCEDPRGGEAACGSADCYIRRCDAPFLDCNFDFQDGCEFDSGGAGVNCDNCPSFCADPSGP
jgi:hypothetical protein